MLCFYLILFVKSIGCSFLHYLYFPQVYLLVVLLVSFSVYAEFFACLLVWQLDVYDGKASGVEGMVISNLIIALSIALF